MALSEEFLAGKLKIIFQAMWDARGTEPKTYEWYAGELARDITAHIKTAEVNTGIEVQGGTQTGGSLTGARTTTKGTIS
jgi:hypothetical protein